ncbi:ABC transporter ATP-binding protein [Oceanobacillus halophilus]|uniref:ABC transporter ATP-binding protein n=1 Tax=Oceanobacillus halophilus TaxID=930130 RepID=UPI001F4D5CFF|nr:dipeptide ABC transporter ATP-binding protein [Oceanobacillus halophilus]
MAHVIESRDILRVENLSKDYPIRGGVLGRVTERIKAVKNVSFNVKKGETFSIVGESGCGKSTTGMCILRLIEATSGRVYLNEKDIFKLNKFQMKNVRSDIQIIFQDPYSSLNPKLTIRKILREPLIINGYGTKSEIDEKIISILEMVGLGAHHLDRYPHEFSGGQRQRIGIARALLLDPQLIICDEPVSALDVSIQSQLLNLLQDLQEKLDLTYVFISHDLSVVQHISDRVAVMYLGEIVEMGPSKEIFDNPKHPYTKALLSSVPKVNEQVRRIQKRIILDGDVPSPKNPPSGCTFHTRCPFAEDICTKFAPEKSNINKDHTVSCHLVENGDII